MKLKKWISVLLTALVMVGTMGGCSAPDNNQSSEVEIKENEQGGGGNATKVGYPKKMTIARTLYYGDSGDALDLKEEWPKAMKEKYGIEFEVISPPRNNYIEKINLMVTSGELTGLVNLFSPEEVIQYKNDGVIEPLDEYLKDNEIWNELPEDMKEMYMVDGQIWAIPMGCTPNGFTRSIRKDWLDNLGLEMPDTVEELYEVSRAFTYDDPDGNGIDDTVGITSAGTWNMQDIFQAFDARLNHVGENSLTWDPNRECYTDSMLHPGMIEALTYLNKMYTEGILDNELFTNKGSNMRDKISSGKYGSSFYWLLYSETFQIATQKNVPEATFAEIPALKGSIDKNINQVTYANPPYVLLKGTEEAKEVVNAFIDIFFGDIEGHLMGVYGIPGVNYEFDGETIYTKVDESGMPIQTAGLIQPIPELNENVYKVLPENPTEKLIEKIDMKIALKQEIFYDKIDSGELYILGNTHAIPSSDTFYNIRGDIQRVFDEAIVKAVTGEITPDEAISKYREQMKKMGAQKILDEANAALGTSCPFSY